MGSQACNRRLQSESQFLELETFKMETIASIIAMLHPGKWTMSFNLKDAYFHIPIAKGSQKYLRFGANRKVFQFVASPLDLPWLPLSSQKSWEP